jgi:hypothetical protein
MLFLLPGIEVQSYSGDAPEVLIAIVKNDASPTCASCHAGKPTGATPVTGGISLGKKDSNRYANGITYDITLSIDTMNKRHGFQFIALNDKMESIGTLSENSSALNIEDDAIYAVKHLSHSNIANTNDSFISFQWTAPATYKGNVRFHAIGVAGDGNRDNTNDKVYYSTFDLTYDASVGLGEALDEFVKIFPNPAADYIQINSGKDDYQQYTILDIQGNVVAMGRIEAKSQNIPVRKLGTGVYFIELLGNGQKSFGRFLIQ